MLKQVTAVHIRTTRIVTCVRQPSFGDETCYDNTVFVITHRILNTVSRYTERKAVNCSNMIPAGKYTHTTATSWQLFFAAKVIPARFVVVSILELKLSKA